MATFRKQKLYKIDVVEKGVVAIFWEEKSDIISWSINLFEKKIHIVSTSQCEQLHAVTIK